MCKYCVAFASISHLSISLLVKKLDLREGFSREGFENTTWELGKTYAKLICNGALKLVK